LAITGLKPLQWAPIDLALEKAFGRNGNRLVFDHDYLRIAVQHRYLLTDKARRWAHSVLADWFGFGLQEGAAEERPWQLQQAGRLRDLCELFLDVENLANLAYQGGEREVINYWRIAKGQCDCELDELITEAVGKEIKERNNNSDDQIWFVDRIADLLEEAGLYRELLLRLRTLSLELEEATGERDEEAMLISLANLANTHANMGQYDIAENLYQRCLQIREEMLGPEHIETLYTALALGSVHYHKCNYEQAEAHAQRALEGLRLLLGHDHPSTPDCINLLGLIYSGKGDCTQAEACFREALELLRRLHGREEISIQPAILNLASILDKIGAYEEAEGYYKRCLDIVEKNFGRDHPLWATLVGNIGSHYRDRGDNEKALTFYRTALDAKERLLGPKHPSTLVTFRNIASLTAGMVNTNHPYLRSRF